MMMINDRGDGLARFGRRWGFFGLILPAVAIMGAQLVLWRFGVGGQADHERLSNLLTTYQANAAIPVVLAGGRLEWMALVLGGLALAPACVLVSLRVLFRNLALTGFVFALLVWLIAGVALFASPWWRPDPLKDAPVLFKLTEAIALPAYGTQFAFMASVTTRLLFVLTMTVTVVVMLAGVSVLSRHYPPGLDNAQSLNAKRRDLKIQLVLASILLTHSTAFMGQWLKWPAVFIGLAAKAATKESVSAATLANGAEQVQAFAEGARLYFGAGYSLALVAVAVPAVLSLSRRLKLVAVEGDAPDFLTHNVLKHDEIAALLTMTAPLLAGAIGVVAKI
ncbi:hypothetical protein [Caulobacter sp. BE254]|uniref:hypothetical protein n=1 Tax=Caulobacter sp. BE254 TaxID=2817720 RepID=UPI002855B058|nr:hypothetical protein [Caulobacter sp. BE254]MDR7117063.1 hypothetical protein [Caulobacter sp. BE254]